MEEHPDQSSTAARYGVYGEPSPAGAPAVCALRDYSGRQVPSFLCFMAVAGGFGPAERSEAAARAAVDTVETEMDPGRFESGEEFSASASRVIEQAVARANSRLLAMDDGSEEVGGATLTCAAADSQSAILAHVGNARAYLLTGRGLRQLTSDHVEHLEAGRTRLTRALGIGEEIESDILRVPLKADEVMMICSHGIYSALEESEIALALGGDDLQSSCRSLTSTARSRGAGGELATVAWRVPGDDVTAPAGPAPGVAPGKHATAGGKPRRRRRWLIALIAVLVLAAAAVGALALTTDWFKSKPSAPAAPAAPKARFVEGDVLQVDTTGKTEGCYLSQYAGGPQQVRLYDGWKVRVVSSVLAGAQRWYRVEVTDGTSAGVEGYVKEIFLVRSR